MGKIKWHIEASSKCILECPLCDRTWFYNKFKKRLNDEINIQHLVNFLDGTSPDVFINGNNGDPIYHSDFHNLCLQLKKINATIEITTNGSGKKKDWWEKLCSILTKDDSIIFSIDGLKDTNHVYRKNADWNSIMDAVEVVTQHDVKTTWKFIVFKHNEHQINNVEEFSKKCGIQNFKLVKSDRWWDKDLMPSKKYVDQSYKHQMAVTEGTEQESIIKQQCMSVQDGNPDTGLYIDSNGDFYPCCKTGLYAFRYKTIFSPKQGKYNIENNSIDQILGDRDVENFFNSTKSYNSADKCCKTYCGAKTNDRKKQESIV